MKNSVIVTSYDTTSVQKMLIFKIILHFFLLSVTPIQIEYCHRIFQSLLTYSIEELCEMANSQIAPVQLGVARPTASFPLVPATADAPAVIRHFAL
jgi:hypothetical protein